MEGQENFQRFSSFKFKWQTNLCEFLICISGIQGESIGDVKFNSDGDRIGRYSVFQYQRVPKEGFKSVKDKFDRTYF